MNSTGKPLFFSVHVCRAQAFFWNNFSNNETFQYLRLSQLVSTVLKYNWLLSGILGHGPASTATMKRCFRLITEGHLQYKNDWNCLASLPVNHNTGAKDTYYHSTACVRYCCSFAIVLWLTEDPCQFPSYFYTKDGLQWWAKTSVHRGCSGRQRNSLDESQLISTQCHTCIMATYKVWLIWDNHDIQYNWHHTVIIISTCVYFRVYNQSKHHLE